MNYFIYFTLIYTVMITIFCLRGGGTGDFFWGGSLYHSNTLRDRTLIGVALNCSTRDCTDQASYQSLVITEIALESLKHSYGTIRHISRLNSLIGQKGQL